MIDPLDLADLAEEVRLRSAVTLDDARFALQLGDLEESERLIDEAETLLRASQLMFTQAERLVTPLADMP